MLATVVIVWIALSAVPAFFIAAAAIRSSQISQQEGMVEVYTAVDESPPIIPNAYPVES